MHAYGPPAERLIDIAVIVVAIDDPAMAVICLKAVCNGVRFRQLVQPDLREELDALIGAIRTRATAEFEAWLARFEVPRRELQRALLLIEEVAQRNMDQLSREMKPLHTSVDTALAAIATAYEKDRLMDSDIIARDIGAALRRTAFRAAEPYSEPLRSFSLSLQIERSPKDAPDEQ